MASSGYSENAILAFNSLGINTIFPGYVQPLTNAVTLFNWVIPIRLVDVVEVGLVAYVLYKLYLLMRGTIAVQFFLVVLALYVIQILVTASNMTILRALFSSISDRLADSRTHPTASFSGRRVLSVVCTNRFVCL